MSAIKEASDTFINIMKDKIGHPFMGSFIFTFFCLNYDILIDLIVNIQDPYAVLFFKSFLYGEWYYRLFIPFVMMFAFPLWIHNRLNYWFSYFKQKTDGDIKNMKEKEKSEIYKYKANKFEKLYLDSVGKNDKSIEKSIAINSFLLNELNRYLRIENLRIMESEERLNEYEFVSYLEDRKKIIPFNRFQVFIGRIGLRITDNLYLVECIPEHKVYSYFHNSVNGKEVYNGQALLLKRDGNISIEKDSKLQNENNVLGKLIQGSGTIDIKANIKNQAILEDKQLLKNILLNVTEND
ncbi:hypothetical protein EHQ43_11755 [Leptospira bouyouniensis]|uniref:Uncharacterized protein n=1 Tax=Leptospira bouyouniensis TaxID=2484911 RepID=A0A7I0HPJ4_9LEPT|nr:hypothetical protein [Leptospira bouyouniensis]TGL04073.1 hypothetical protein EHQ43_11755 [Leptospira bouyouniensis]